MLHRAGVHSEHDNHLQRIIAANSWNIRAPRRSCVLHVDIRSRVAVLVVPSRRCIGSSVAGPARLSSTSPPRRPLPKSSVRLRSRCVIIAVYRCRTPHPRSRPNTGELSFVYAVASSIVRLEAAAASIRNGLSSIGSKSSAPCCARFFTSSVPCASLMLSVAVPKGLQLLSRSLLAGSSHSCHGGRSTWMRRERAPWWRWPRS